MRRGFTVLEVLLAIVLGTALLACLWSALSLYLRAFDSGRTEVERTQLVRALVRKIETDLQRTLPQPNSPPQLPAVATASEAPPLSSPEPRPSNESIESSAFPADAPESATLVGTAHQLRLRVCQSRLAQRELPTAKVLGADVVRLPDDLKTIYYWLAESQAADASAPTGAATHRGSGLVRKEGPWLRPRDDASSTAGSQPLRAGDLADPNDLTLFYESRLPEQNEYPDRSIVVAPEVAGLEFRYFDGIAWVEQWNSATQGRLPRAVEVSIFLRDGDQESETLATTTAPTTPELTADFRMVVVLQLGGAKNSPPSKTVQPVDEVVAPPLSAGVLP